MFILKGFKHSLKSDQANLTKYLDRHWTSGQHLFLNPPPPTKVENAPFFDKKKHDFVLFRASLWVEFCESGFEAAGLTVKTQ